jgi:hypothetical protein
MSGLNTVGLVFLVSGFSDQFHSDACGENSNDKRGDDHSISQTSLLFRVAKNSSGHT